MGRSIRAMKRSILLSLSIIVLLLAVNTGAQQQPKRPLLSFTRHDKYGYINRAGEVVVKPSFDRADEFSEGLAYVAVGDRYGYIDEAGKLVIKPQFKEAY